MKISYARPEQKEFIEPQVVPLRNSIYGGMLASYSAPFDQLKYQSTEKETKIAVSFLATHAYSPINGGWEKLPAFSEAKAFLRAAIFWSPTSGKATALFRLWAALLAGKATPEEIVDWSDADFPDLDEYIGHPLKFSAGVSTRPNKSGIFMNKVESDSIEPADAALKRAIAPIYKEAQMEYTQDAQPRRHLRSPKSAILEDGLSVHQFLMQGISGDSHDANDILDEEEIPF